jgi:NADH:ubiquinone oxidoreductase subunit B-like Fe-S oxidoreductase
VDEVIPVDVFIPGCPPRPEAIVDGIIQLLTHLKSGNPSPSHARPIPEEVVA